MQLCYCSCCSRYADFIILISASVNEIKTIVRLNWALERQYDIVFAVIQIKLLASCCKIKAKAGNAGQ